MPYDGGRVANIGGGCARGRVNGAEATREYWLAVNGLTGVEPTQTVIDLDQTDAVPANRFVYGGAVLVNPNPLTGTQNRDVEFAEIAWAFFKARTPVAALPGPEVPMSAPLSPEAIQAARDYGFSAGGQTFLVMHNGQILDEAYANGGGPDKPQLLASATKGFTGMIGAIAASDGLFDLDEPVAQRALVEWQPDPRKSKITYRHLLTMTSGLEDTRDIKPIVDDPLVPGDFVMAAGAYDQRLYVIPSLA